MNEWRWSKASFDRLDVNGNGSLEQAELTSNVQPRANTYQPPQGNAYQKGVERGLIDGRKAGLEDTTRANRCLDGQRELEQADAGFTPALGARSEYHAGYREGFKTGYREGFGPRL